jgi:hypothetical protein
MYYEILQEVSQYLRGRGLRPEVVIGDPVDRDMLSKLEDDYCVTLPEDYRVFLAELGDGFYFRLEDGSISCGFERVSDSFAELKFIRTCIDYDARQEHVRNNPFQEVVAEAERRRKWFPIFNIGGGGYLFCIDCSSPEGAIRNYDSVYWPNDDKEEWSFRMADSFFEFFKTWSDYCFSEPPGTLINHALHGRGQFQWDSYDFPIEFRRFGDRLAGEDFQTSCDRVVSETPANDDWKDIVSHQSTRTGKTWYLHSRTYPERRLFFFKSSVEPTSALTKIPDGFTIVEHGPTCIPFLKKSSILSDPA